MSDDTDMFLAAEDAYRYSGSIRADNGPSNGTRLEHIVMVMCDSTRKGTTRWTLVKRHGKPKRRTRCPRCGRWARIEDVNGTG